MVSQGTTHGTVEGVTGQRMYQAAGDATLHGLVSGLARL